MLKCLIIDDEPLAREVLAGYIEADPDLDVPESFSNAHKAISHLKNNHADVLFLDIEMPEMSGIELLRSLDKPPITVFTTAFRDYAFEGFELGVIDFLLKPVSQERFRVAVDKIRDFLLLKNANSDIELSNETPDFVFVKSGVERIKLFFSEVTHIQGLKDYAIIYSKSRKIVVKGSVKYMQDLFPGQFFIRVHKSFIVSKAKIGRITRNKIIIGSHEIPIGRNYKEDLENQVIGKYNS